MSTNYCPNCGVAVDPNATLCPNCGAAIGFEDTPTEEAPQPPPSAPETQIVYGKFGERLLAVIIDAIVVGIITWIVAAILSPFFPLLIVPAGPYPPWTVSIGVINWPIALLYWWILEAYEGQTIGKRALNLRTVDEESLAVASAGQCLVNNLSRGSGWIIADFIIGIIANSGDEKKRLRILQNLSKTVVISVKETT